LGKRLVLPENVSSPLGGRLKDAEKEHGPPVSDQRWHNDRHSVGAIGIKSRMRLRADRHALLHLQIEQDLVGIKSIAEIPERQPLGPAIRRLSSVCLKNQMSVVADVKLKVVGVKQFNPILSSFRKWYAWPYLLA
jgi:hypothetical protein